MAIATSSVPASPWTPIATHSPPDLAIEIDIGNASSQKPPLCQVLGVAELWVYSKGIMRILDLRTSQIQDTYSSLAFPTVSAVQLQRWVEQREIMSDLAIVKAMSGSFAKP